MATQIVPPLTDIGASRSSSELNEEQLDLLNDTLSLLRERFSSMSVDQQLATAIRIDALQ